MKTTVAIIGAGPAGLTAAYLLSKNEVDVTVLEADPVYVGGISRTATYKGFHFFLSDPITPRKIPNIPTLDAEPRRTDQRGHRHAECPQDRRRGAILMHEVQKRQYD